MMKKLILAGIAMMTIAISSCDEDTTTLGDSLTSNVDKFVSLSDSYQVQTQSVMTDSVLATSLYRYLGKIKDPETGSFISCDYMTQFNILENLNAAIFPEEDVIAKDDNNLPVADSCCIRIMVSSFQGDSLAAMKLRVTELAKPVPNSSKYYTDFDPEEEGYLRSDKDASGNPISIVNQTKVYSVSDLTQSDSLRNVLRGTDYYQYITIPLTGAYTDKDGTTYDGYDSSKKAGTGYGTYLLRKYYSSPASFKNSNAFAHNVCPGFYIKTIDGLDNMLEIANTQLIVFFHYKNGDATINYSRAFMSTQEVLQTTHITNDKDKIKALEKIDTCTFLKTPSGLFTEVSLPIDSIKWLKKKDANGLELPSHENDTLMSAKITFQQMRSQSDLSGTLLKEPSNLLMIPRDKLYSFFEGNSTPDNVTSYLATYNSTQKTYTFSSLTSLINSIYSTMQPEITNPDGTVNPDKVAAYTAAHPNWNKVVLVPVTLSTTTTSSGSTSVAAVSNSLNISSVRLVGGSNNQHTPISISVIYSKNE